MKTRIKVKISVQYRQIIVFQTGIEKKSEKYEESIRLLGF